MPSIRIALVDDEPDFRQPMARYLRKRGMTVYEAGSVEELRPVLSEVAPNIILLDVACSVKVAWTRSKACATKAKPVSSW